MSAIGVCWLTCLLFHSLLPFSMMYEQPHAPLGSLLYASHSPTQHGGFAFAGGFNVPS